VDNGASGKHKAQEAGGMCRKGDFSLYTILCLSDFELCRMHYLLKNNYHSHFEKENQRREAESWELSRCGREEGTRRRPRGKASTCKEPVPRGRMPGWGTFRT
jgi:hypothetical protein